MKKRTKFLALFLAVLFVVPSVSYGTTNKITKLGERYDFSAEVRHRVYTYLDVTVHSDGRVISHAEFSNGQRAQGMTLCVQAVIEGSDGTPLVAIRHQAGLNPTYGLGGARTRKTRTEGLLVHPEQLLGGRITTRSWHCGTDRAAWLRDYVIVAARLVLEVIAAPEPPTGPGSSSGPALNPMMF